MFCCFCLHHTFFNLHCQVFFVSSRNIFVESSYYMC
nr:MAG TPA: hypothetical protein [Caudoviricetes sp.]